jgi:hypothetical protein
MASISIPFEWSGRFRSEFDRWIKDGFRNESLIVWSEPSEGPPIGNCATYHRVSEQFLDVLRQTTIPFRLMGG